MNTLNLPEPIAAYFAADRQGDPASIAQYFTDQAVVRDEGRTHAGAAAIKAWKTETSTKYSYTSEPIGLEAADAVHVVTSRLTGNFPGSPVNLRFAFRLEGNRIAYLEIAP
jgi:limonene-1,2-epoxide hydrolase